MPRTLKKICNGIEYRRTFDYPMMLRHHRLLLIRFKLLIRACRTGKRGDLRAAQLLHTIILVAKDSGIRIVDLEIVRHDKHTGKNAEKELIEQIEVFHKHLSNYLQGWDDMLLTETCLQALHEVAGNIARIYKFDIQKGIFEILTR